MDGNFRRDSLERIMLVDGMVFARFAKRPRSSVSVALGDRSAQLEPCNPDVAKRYAGSHRMPLSTFQIATDIVSSPPENAPGERYAVWVNELDDWSLAGCQTLQLMIVNRNSPLTVFCSRPILVDGAAQKTGLSFQARIAIHRAAAALTVTFTDQSDGSETKRRVIFDPNFIGGRHESGYQFVDLPLPTNGKGSGRIAVTFDIEYQEFKDDGSGGEPFIFVADAFVGSQTSKSDPPLAPIVLDYSDETSKGVANWMSAPLPAFPDPGTLVTLAVGKDKETLKLPDRPQFEVKENHHHTFIIDAKSDALLALYVDGEIDRLFAVSAGQVAVRLSNRFMDGTTHRVSLRDPSGSVTFWDSYSLVPAITTPTEILQRESAPPFPDTVFAQMPMRYRSLKDLIARAAEEGESITELADVFTAIQALERGHDQAKLLPLKFPEVEHPDVSIVMPAHNKVELTYVALASLLVATNAVSFEVIVVDDASTDEMSELETIVSGITVIHNSEPQRFIRACNIGAKKARGRYVALLNNDTEVTSGWLDELVLAFERFGNVGLVGSKLLYPNGVLQDAGGIVWGSGDPWNYGRGGNPNEPRFSYARKVDYLTGAAIMTTKAIWDEVGGLSSYLEPMYFDDVDLSFKVRAAGYSTWFVPSSIVYHYEGMTAGIDTGSGIKRFQELNRPKFKRRWAGSYAGNGTLGVGAELEKDRGVVGRVLFVDYTTPRADHDAGSYATIQEMKLVQSLGYKVTFLPTNLAHLGSYTLELQKAGIEVIYAPFFMSVNEFLAQRASEFDAFYMTRYYVAREVLDKIKSYAPRARLIFNNCDLHFLREIRAARAENDLNRLEEARQTRELELGVIEQVDLVLSYNTSEHAVIEAYTEGRAKTVLTPWVVELSETVAPLDGRSGLSFLGNFLHSPNGEAMQWFVNEIMPLLTGRPGKPIPVLSIYGAKMTTQIKAMSSKTVNPVGFIENIADAYDKHRIFVAPLLSGAGLKGKVMAAMAHGIPCVLSPIAAEGIGLRSDTDCIIARTPDDWVKGIDALNTDGDLWSRVSEAARAHMANSYGFERGRVAMQEAFEAADLFKHGLNA